MQQQATPLKLYDTQRSGNAWKVRLMAGFLGVPLVRQTLSIDRGDLRGDPFCRIAPLGLVPVLEVEPGEYLYESMAILFRLAQGTPWWPSEINDQTRVLTWLSFEQSRHMHPIVKLRLLFGLKTLKSATEAEVAHWTAEAHEALGILERQLSPRPGQWVCTAAHPSIADVALYPYTRMSPMGRIDLSAYPAIEDWLARFEQLPGYQWLFPDIPGSNLNTAELP
jgi:glutathione S-transferase